MKIFPAIDIKDKKCVRLVKGDFDNKTEYEMSPVEQAGKYKDHVFKNLHISEIFLSEFTAKSSFSMKRQFLSFLYFL